jgi:hypothetical protein
MWGTARRRGRVAIRFLVLPAAMLALAACSPQPPPTARSSPSPVATSAPVSPSPTPAPPGPSPAPTASPSGPGSGPRPTPVAAGVGRCTDSQLRVGAGSWVGAGGHGGIPILFTNRSTVACTLYGYPGVAILSASGRQVEQAQRTPGGYLGGLWSGGNAPVVTLDPGVTAAAELEWIENPQAPKQTTCPTYGAILVTPPNAYRSTELKVAPPILLCLDLDIHPVVPGTTGRN